MAKILLVEDDKLLQKGLGDKLKLEDFEVVVAKNGEEGLKKALEEKPDLILLDVAMPKMGGIEVLKKLREDKWGKKAKVIILTNIEDKENVKEAAKGDVYDYLVKSNWSIEELVKLVRRILID